MRIAWPFSSNPLMSPIIAPPLRGSFDIDRTGAVEHQPHRIGATEHGAGVGAAKRTSRGRASVSRLASTEAASGSAFFGAPPLPPELASARRLGRFHRRCVVGSEAARLSELRLLRCGRHSSAAGAASATGRYVLGDRHLLGGRVLRCCLLGRRRRYASPGLILIPACSAIARGDREARPALAAASPRQRLAVRNLLRRHLGRRDLRGDLRFDRRRSFGRRRFLHRWKATSMT